LTRKGDRRLLQDTNPKTREVLEKDRTFMGAVGKWRLYPMVIEEAKGIIVRDPDGREYLDFHAAWGSANVGHSHPAVLDAIRQQLEKVSCVSTLIHPNRVSINLAEKLVALTPGDFAKKVWYGHSGSDACDCVYKILLNSRKRPRIISFIGSYHGQTMGALSMSGTKLQVKPLGSPAITKVPYAYCYRCPFKLEYSNCDMYCISFIEEYIFETICLPEDVSGMVVEPIESDGGEIVPPPEYIPKLKKLCEKHDILFVDDEVKVGFGRTGKMFAVQHSNVEPDILVLGKPIASGMPLSACVGRAEVLDSIMPPHLFTLALLQ
jgi:4-aminobutyrate aminotransferase